MNQYVLAQQNASAGILGFLPIVLIVAVFYLLVYRPMRKRQKAVETMIGNLKNGDKVVTSGGIYGTVAGLRDHTVLLKVSDQVKIEVAKSAIASLQPPSPESSTK
jgi:preprotein translocase subunit YajC